MNRFKTIKIGLVVLVVMIISFTTLAFNSKNDYKKIIQLSEHQYTKLLTEIENLNTSENIPYSINDDNSLLLVSPKSWTSGFFSGSLWYLYELTGNLKWKASASTYTEQLDTIQYYTGDHDLGFMINCSFGNGLRLTNKESYKKVMVNAAKSLSTRFNSKLGVIKSWDNFYPKDGGVYKFPVIIDNMMNLELLFRATEISGDSIFWEIAVSHADVTLKNHFREDYSCYHVVCYDSNSGGLLAKKTAQGYGHESAWARGQAWALYGYVMCYRFTKEKKYLTQAKEVANYLINHPSLPIDKINLWDLDANTEMIDPILAHVNNEEYKKQRDVSSSAIIASALYELCEYVEYSSTYYEFAENVIQALSSESYLSAHRFNSYYILSNSVASIPSKQLVNKPLNYADYYFLEALVRRSRIDKN